VGEELVFGLARRSSRWVDPALTLPGPCSRSVLITELLDRLTKALADRYRIERELGAGGMATVYLAQDVKHHRAVAVKVLRPEIATTLGAARFFREIGVAAQLQHPHILPLLDSGETNGFFYYVMPLVEGESLRPWTAHRRPAFLLHHR